MKNEIELQAEHVAQSLFVVRLKAYLVVPHESRNKYDGDLSL